MNVLIACEESQRVCKAFREKGANAFSCDIQECSGGHPEWHIQEDVLELISGNVTFVTMDGTLHRFHEKWDLIIAHPPCTYLTNSGNKYFDINKYGEKALERHKHREKAVQFFMSFVNADCEHIAIENPVGYMSTHFRKPDCTYNPYNFEGETMQKRTCLWLKNLPPLKPTRKTPLEWFEIGTEWYDTNAFGQWGTEECKRLRSKTPKGVAKAMAEQWYDYIEKELNKNE